MKNNRKLSKLHILTASLVALFLLASLFGLVYAKYMKTVAFPDKVNVSVRADLLESMELFEHEAVRQADGSYKLNADKKVTENTYTLLPGLDVPKDPQIVITGKTATGAYLYIEVVEDDANINISYNLTDSWLLLDGIQGKNSGKVYVYSDAERKPIVLDNTFDQDGTGAVEILKDNTVYISEALNRGNVSYPVSIQFYAYMAQAIDGMKVDEVYKACFGLKNDADDELK